MTTLLGKALRSARAEKRWTQQQVADALGITRVAVGQWEKGETQPSTANLLAVCKLLGLDVAAASGGTVQYRRVVSPHPDDQTRVRLQPVIRDRREGREGSDPLSGLSAIFKEVPIVETGLDFTKRPGLIFNKSTPGSFLMKLNPVGYMKTPPGFQSAQGLFAMYVPTSAMSPRFDLGELIFIQSGRPPAPGEYVIATLNEADEDDADIQVCRIFLLTSRGADAIKGETFAPHSTVSIKRSDIKSLVRIVPWTELFE
jgi:transcriptional regulator with XRE-family HTH domain